MKKTLPTGSALREGFHPRLEKMVEEIRSQFEVEDESYSRRMVRLFARFAAKLAVRYNVDEQEYMNEAHAAYHNEVDAKQEEPTAQA